MKQVGIFGTSGFAREVNDIAPDLGFEPIYVARDQSEADAGTFTGEVILERNVQQLKKADFGICSVEIKFVLSSNVGSQKRVVYGSV